MSESYLILQQAPACDPGDWADALAAVALACADGSARDEPRLLRALHALLVAAPYRGLTAGIALPDAARFAALIAARAGDAAALALLGADCGYMLSRGNHGEHLASVILPGQSAETRATGETLALALVGATALALGAVRTAAGAPHEAERRPAMRLH